VHTDNLHGRARNSHEQILLFSGCEKPHQASQEDLEHVVETGIQFGEEGCELQVQVWYFLTVLVTSASFAFQTRVYPHQ
jgi:hypothetical protein